MIAERRAFDVVSGGQAQKRLVARLVYPHYRTAIRAGDVLEHVPNVDLLSVRGYWCGEVAHGFPPSFARAVAACHALRAKSEANMRSSG